MTEPTSKTANKTGSSRRTKTSITAKTAPNTKVSETHALSQIFSPSDQLTYPKSAEKCFQTSAARQIAYDAVLEIANSESEIGECLGVFSYPVNLAAFYFPAHVLGYRNWLWVSLLTLGKVSGKPEALEVFMTPDQSALLPKPWLDWSLRLMPEDANVYDELPYRADDPNLTAGLNPSMLNQQFGIDDTPLENDSNSRSKTARTKKGAAKFSENSDQADKLALLQHITQLYALSRERLLSPAGREQAAERWYASSQGPNGPSAKNTALPCSTCGFFVPILGALGQAFGVCATNWSQDDGKVVAWDHGCGSHSESRIVPIVDRYLGPALEIDESIEWG
jgi:hypothetical protein